MRAIQLSALVAVVISGCVTDIGECDEAAARRVVLRSCPPGSVDPESGVPMYEGQAIVNSSCGANQFCHSQFARGDDRHGVPHGLNFDFGVVCHNKQCRYFESGAETAADVREHDALVELEGSQRRALEWARYLITDVRRGSMPPGGIGSAIASGGPQFEYPDGSGFLPRAGTHAANEILRNWLACGAPVVESTFPASAGLEGRNCNAPDDRDHVGDCVTGRLPCIPVPAANWGGEDGIFAVIIRPLCGATCHNESSPGFENHNLDLDMGANAAAVLASLRSRAGDGSECGESKSQLLLLEQPAENSLFFRKLTGDVDPVTGEFCGSTMPPASGLLPPDVIEIFRQWIETAPAP